MASDEPLNLNLGEKCKALALGLAESTHIHGNGIKLHPGSERILCTSETCLAYPQREERTFENENYFLCPGLGYDDGKMAEYFGKFKQQQNPPSSEFSFSLSRRRVAR